MRILRMIGGIGVGLLVVCLLAGGVWADTRGREIRNNIVWGDPDTPITCKQHDVSVSAATFSSMIARVRISPKSATAYVRTAGAAAPRVRVEGKILGLSVSIRR